MLSVLLNEDIRVLKFEKPTSPIFWNRDRLGFKKFFKAMEGLMPWARCQF
jgi:hypothetical protein